MLKRNIPPSPCSCDVTRACRGGRSGAGIVHTDLPPRKTPPIRTRTRSFEGPSRGDRAGSGIRKIHEAWRNQSTRWVGVRMLLMSTILAIGAGAIEASAQAPDASIDQSAAARPWWLLWSRTWRQDRVLWAMCFRHMDNTMRSVWWGTTRRPRSWSWPGYCDSSTGCSNTACSFSLPPTLSSAARSASPVSPKRLESIQPRGPPIGSRQRLWPRRLTSLR